MATEHTKNDPDYRFHEESYSNVIAMIKGSIAVIVITLALLAWLVV